MLCHQCIIYCIKAAREMLAFWRTCYRSVSRSYESATISPYHGSSHLRMGAGSLLHKGRKLNNSRVCRRASMSLSNAPCATPEVVVWVLAPPSSSWVTSSLVTAWKTSKLHLFLETLSFYGKTQNVFVQYHVPTHINVTVTHVQYRLFVICKGVVWHTCTCTFVYDHL